VHTKYPPVAPSPIKDKMTGLIPRELSLEEIYELINKFVAAGYRAYLSGYDMVQLHAAHGYLLSNFISPYTNRRVDDFGGNLINMTKILEMIYEQLKDKVGKDFPVIIKLQMQDFVPGGLKVDEGIKIAERLINKGFNAIEPSGGIGETQMGTKDAYPSKVIHTLEEENYFLPWAKQLKPIMKNCKLILVGGIKNPLSAEQILKEGNANFISMSRPLLYEPDLPNRWRNGDISPAKCTSCNSCYFTMLKEPTYCVVRRKLERKKQRESKDKTLEQL
jgi:2,4-dienoyl-CoA reductase-like NADH-dependent reductase (Old Yellow Enzyme family)